MKKILSIILVITIILSFSACGKKSAEKYCFSCGEGIPKNATFCEHCGTKINSEKTESTTDNSGTSQTTSVTSNALSTTSKSTQTNTSNKVVQNSKPVTTTSKAPTHTHSYSKKVTAATCTAQGYTTHTCSCGHSYKDSYTNPAHSFSNYKCTKCSMVDKAYAYDYLVLWVKQNGVTSGTDVEYKVNNNDLTFCLGYSAQYEDLYIEEFGDINGDFLFSMILLDEWFYGVSLEETELKGYINPEEFTNTSPISFEEYTGPSSSKYDFIELSRIVLNDLVLFLSEIIKEKEIGITLSDLGFKSYK